jgi:hypothetical protein
LTFVVSGETAQISLWTPCLSVHETGPGCRLTLGGVTSGRGATLQDAADDLIARLLSIAMAIRASGLRVTPELGRPDPHVLRFLREIGELAATGEDIRRHVFVPQPSEDPTH